MTDEKFFADNPERHTRIRMPERELQKDKQRAVRYLDEMELQFRSLGAHKLDQRRIIVWRVPADHPAFTDGGLRLMPIPVLAFQGEVIHDTDEVLLPILDELMRAQPQ